MRDENQLANDLIKLSKINKKLTAENKQLKEIVEMQNNDIEYVVRVNSENAKAYKILDSRYTNYRNQVNHYKQSFLFKLWRFFKNNKKK